MSLIADLGLSFHFMLKNGQLFDYLSEFCFSKFYKKRTRNCIIRHSSLHGNVFNTSVKF